MTNVGYCSIQVPAVTEGGMVADLGVKKSTLPTSLSPPHVPFPSSVSFYDFVTLSPRIF